MKKKAGHTSQDLQKQVTELTEALQRERADSVNLRRRVEEERLTMANFYKALIVKDLLPIIDNCERLLDHISAHSKVTPWKEGAEKIVKQAYKTLEDFGIERIKTEGQAFDPRYHEAVSVEEGPSTGSGQEHEIVSQELQAGYKLGDEVIRPAMVRVKRR